jgi:heme oxygenase-like protein
MNEHTSTSVEQRRGADAPTSIVDFYEGIEVKDHPLFETLAARPVDLSALWVLVANMNEGISPNFVRWLASTIARIDDSRLASLLAKQLSDELGNGDPERIHRTLLERFVAGLEPWRPRGPGGRSLDAGRRLAERASAVFESGAPFEAIGGMIVAEIFAKKMDHCLGEEIRRQSLVPREALLWLDIHEVLEVDHAEDSRGLAELVPAGGPAAHEAWQGARALWSAMWGFLDDVMAAAYAHA